MFDGVKVSWELAPTMTQWSTDTTVGIADGAADADEGRMSPIENVVAESGIELAGVSRVKEGRRLSVKVVASVVNGVGDVVCVVPVGVAVVVAAAEEEAEFPSAFALNSSNFLPGLIANTMPDCRQCVACRQYAQMGSVLVTVISAPGKGPSTLSASTGWLQGRQEATTANRMATLTSPSRNLQG
jgi:hypothetical protein